MSNTAINKIVFDFGGAICDFKIREYFWMLGYNKSDIGCFFKQRIEFYVNIWYNMYVNL